MKKRILAILMVASMCLSLTACGGGSNVSDSNTQEKAVASKEYIEETQIADLFSEPESLKGKYVKLTGKIFTAPEKDGDTLALQAWHDITNASNNFIVYCSSENNSFKEGDFVTVDGEIQGLFNGENAFGGQVSAPVIKADTVEVQSYMDAVAPTTKEIIPENAIIEQNGISLGVDKVEFSDSETRIYLTEANASQEKFSMWVYSIKIVQNGQQIEQDSSSMSAYEGEYPQLSDDILPSASSSGILVFPPMDSSAGFQIYAEGSSDNYELEFQPFTIDIAP